MDVDDSDEYEEEECFVYVDLETKLLEDQLSSPNIKIKFLGMDTEHPIMQLNNKIFKGNYDYAMGTNVFFAEDPQPPSADLNYHEMPNRMYEYFGKTNKVLKMKRIFVEENDKAGDIFESPENENENIEHLRVTKTYEEALNQFLKPGEKPPRKIVTETNASADVEPNATADISDVPMESTVTTSGAEEVVVAESSINDENLEKTVNKHLAELLYDPDLG